MTKRQIEAPTTKEGRDSLKKFLGGKDGQYGLPTKDAYPALAAHGVVEDFANTARRHKATGDSLSGEQEKKSKVSKGRRAATAVLAATTLATLANQTDIEEPIKPVVEPIVDTIDKAGEYITQEDDAKRMTEGSMGVSAPAELPADPKNLVVKVGQGPSA